MSPIYPILLFPSLPKPSCCFCCSVAQVVSDSWQPQGLHRLWGRTESNTTEVTWQPQQQQQGAKKILPEEIRGGEESTAGGDGVEGAGEHEEVKRMHWESV